jgi:ATP synthase protein I
MAATSALIGASASLMGNGIAAVWAFRVYRAQEPERILMRLYGAEAAKVALILAILGIAIATLDGIEIPILLGAFFVVQVASPMVAAQLDNLPSRGSGERKQK